MSKEALAAARAMGRQGLEDRLREINMGEGEWETYLRYFQRIQLQVQVLRNVPRPSSRGGRTRLAAAPGQRRARR